MLLLVNPWPSQPRELFKALKSLDLLNKTSVWGTSVLKVNNTMSFETKSILDVFKNYYSNLADSLLKKLQCPPNKYTLNSAIQYDRYFIQTDVFYLKYSTEIYIKNLRSTNNRQAAVIGEMLGRFLRDGSQVLSESVSDLYNLSFRLGSFPDSCKIKNWNLYSKQGPKQWNFTQLSIRISKKLPGIFTRQVRFCMIKFWKVSIRVW